MFLSLKDKFINVTKNVGLTQDVAKKTDLSVQQRCDVNIDAGAAILNHFQIQWEQMHNLNEDNAKNASNCAEIIETIYNRITKDHDNFNKISSMLSAPTNISMAVEKCVTKLSELHLMFGTVEKELIDLENLIETFELQEKQLEHKFQLSLYKEKRMAAMDNLRTNLAAQHSQNVCNFELKQHRKLQERQQVFQEAFNSDLETFKNIGSIPKIESPSRQPSALLEEIQLDNDDTELEKFLDLEK